MTKIKIFLLSLIIAPVLYLGLKTQVKALTFDYPIYDVRIEINEDSTFTVKETATYSFTGDTHGLRRDITLDDPFLNQTCAQNNNLTCGGFDRIIPISVTGQGEKLDDGEYTTYEVEDVSGKKYLRFEWEIWPDGKYLNGDEITWTIEYKILGGISWQYADSTRAGTTRPFFYWNALPENRGGNVERARVTLVLPDSTNLNQDSFKEYTSYRSQKSFNTDANTVTTILSNLNSYGAYTISYLFNEDEIVEPATVNYEIKSPLFGAEVWVDGLLISKETEDSIKGYPAGSHKLEFKAFGYKTETHDLNLESGEEIDLEVTLKREPWMQVLYYLSIMIALAGCVLTPVAGFGAVLLFLRKGRDKNKPKTIIPIFHPPKKVSPYMVGSLKDEKVDKEDVVGSIIDLAYRGFIKIKEIKKKKNYQLTRLEKNEEELDEIEKELLEAIFNGDTEVETKDMKTYFPLKYQKLVNKINEKMVTDKYFASSPSTTRAKYFGLAIAANSFGIATLIGISMLASGFIGVFAIFTPGLALIVFGSVLMLFAYYMPAKTELGSKILNEILGFRMYLQTAERFRLQNLGPEEFEKYLSYAVTFKIEKQWAEKFKDIYKGVPNWYEGSSDGVYDALFVSSLMRNFSDTTVASATPVSSSSGGGWSGGGGSGGGFSGGGGGGGSSGGW